MKKKILSLILVFILSISMMGTSLAKEPASTKKNKKDILIDKIVTYEGAAQNPNAALNKGVLEENPPEYWQYGGSTTYNQLIRDVVAGTIAGALFGWMAGVQSTWRSVATALLGSWVGGSASSTLWAKKTLYYKLNYNGNGYPYYCQEIVETWLSPSYGTHVQTTVKYFYSYQPY